MAFMSEVSVARCHTSQSFCMPTTIGCQAHTFLSCRQIQQHQITRASGGSGISTSSQEIEAASIPEGSKQPETEAASETVKKVKAGAIPKILKVLTNGVFPEMWRKFQTEFVKNHEPAIVNQVVARLKSSGPTISYGAVQDIRKVDEHAKASVSILDQGTFVEAAINVAEVRDSKLESILIPYIEQATSEMRQAQADREKWQREQRRRWAFIVLMMLSALFFFSVRFEVTPVIQMLTWARCSGDTASWFGVLFSFIFGGVGVFI